MGSAIAIVIILISAGFIIFALFDAARTHFSSKDKIGKDLCDPATCDHEWEPSESGTCMPSYSSTGGPDPQETWTVERCPHCSASYFHCTGTCNPDECVMRGNY